MRFVFLIFILISAGFVVGAGGGNFGKVASDSVIEDFEDGAKKVKVVLKMNNDLGLKARSSEKGSKKSSSKYVVKEISLKELEALQFDSGVEKIFSENHLHAFLREAVGIVDSNLTNDLEVNSINLTGVGQTVCIIDTGVNFSHPDLLGKNMSCVVDCYDKTCVENCSIGDDNGHGTHVAGIVAASGGITGMAPNVSLIGVKILDSGGDGSVNEDDLPNAIDWCVAQNVDVITMSLGTATLFSSVCDASVSAWATSIDAAVAQSIVVVAASGNDGSQTQISAPACISNAIAVGDTYDGNVNGIEWIGTCTDSTTALDQIVCHANRNSLVKLFAPGAMINSTLNTGGYVEQGGTSMATPMVAGAISLIRQYLNLSSQTKTSSEIEDVLNDTGVVLDDTNNSGFNFSRINVYNALLSLDVDAPNVTLISPSNDEINLSVNQSFVCNATDWQLANMTLEVWNSTGLYYNVANNLTGTENETSFDLENMSEDTYSWNCLGMDVLGNSGYAFSNFSLTIGGIVTTLISPVTENYTNVNETNFTCNVASDAGHDLTNVSFYLWNSSNESLIYNFTEIISGLDNTTVFNYTFVEEGNYSWNCLGVNNVSNESWGNNNFTVIYDVTAPVISSPGEAVSSSGATITWTTDEVANSSISVSSGSWSNSSDYVASHSIVVSGLGASTSYNYNMSSCDRAGNCGNASDSFTTSAAPVSNNPGGGGSSTSSSGAATTSAVPTIHDATSSEVAKGYTKSLKKGERINFSIFDFEGGRHLLAVNEVGIDYVNLTIESDPINLTLGVGQSVRLNLTSPNYYDLFVGLNNVTNGSAELTIQLINEPIEAVIVIEKEVVKEKFIVGKDYFWVVIVLIVVLVVTVLVVVRVNRKKLKGKKAKKRKKNGRKNKKTKA